jgi:hypothetical protein
VPKLGLEYIRSARPFATFALASSIASSIGSGLVSGATAAPPAPQSLALELVTGGLTQPVHLTSAPGDPRLFVCQNDGLVKVLIGGVALAAPFLDLRADVHPVEGLGSLAFHPNYPATPFVYVAYLDVQVRARLVRYTLSPDPNRLDPTSALDMLPPAQKT